MSQFLKMNLGQVLLDQNSQVQNLIISNCPNQMSLSQSKNSVAQGQV